MVNLLPCVMLGHLPLYVSASLGVSARVNVSGNAPMGILNFMSLKLLYPLTIRSCKSLDVESLVKSNL